MATLTLENWSYDFSSSIDAELTWQGLNNELATFVGHTFHIDKTFDIGLTITSASGPNINYTNASGRNAGVWLRDTDDTSLSPDTWYQLHYFRWSQTVEAGSYQAGIYMIPNGHGYTKGDFTVNIRAVRDDGATPLDIGNIETAMKGDDFLTINSAFTTSDTDDAFLFSVEQQVTFTLDATVRPEFTHLATASARVESITGTATETDIGGGRLLYTLSAGTYLIRSTGDYFIDEPFIEYDVEITDFAITAAPLFTQGHDTVSFNSVTKGYRQGTQYNALNGNDLVHLPDNAAAAARSGFVPGTMFYGGGGHDEIFGGGLADFIDGGAGPDYLVGNGGNDTLIGGADLDTLFGGDGNDILQGGDGGDTLFGGRGNDRLDGGAGADWLEGGLGNDVYVVDTTADRVIEVAGQGTDTVQSSVSLTLAANVENLTLLGTAALRGTGNSLNNVITGNSANNVLSGGIGNDRLRGLAGNDTLNGGAGADRLEGGAGNDSYVVDNPGDVVVEALNAGTDRVSSSITYTLTANVENLTLTGRASINGTGNNLDNVITGNIADNVLNGGAGNDTLNGAAGNDRMLGGAGNDTYHVNTIGDLTIELANQGTDTVLSTVTHTLSAHVENLTLRGATAINGTGNGLNNVIIGNTGNNVLSGAGGNDILKGGAGHDRLLGGNGHDTLEGEAGNDRLFGDGGNDVLDGGIGNDILAGGAGSDRLFGGAGNDTLDGGAGTDRLVGGFGHDTLFGGEGNDALFGEAGNDTIDGGNGADMLLGGFGNDILTGGDGADTFVFDTALSAINVDTITDFNVADDTMRLNKVIFTKLTTNGELNATFFRIGPQALDADDYIVYDAATGALIYDSNGNAAGGAIQFATLAPNLGLTAADFFVV